MSNNSSTPALREALTRALKEVQRLQAQQAERRSGPIAIVSMACRLPGGIASPEDYWRLLSEGRDAIEVFPSRWDAFSIYDPDPEAVGKSYVREGGFLRDVDLFDAGFFGISPREAQSMDPQQRLVLETAWEALERAGVRPASLSESATGVFLGAMGSDYGALQGSDLESLDGYRGTGTMGSVISGRVAYALGLQGPAITVDTACSSSLVALHLACAALRRGECELALVGGVAVMSTPAGFVEFSRLKGLPRDGRCKSFSARADGAIWSEGCAMLVLKRLSDAQRDGDRVLAVVRGSAVNQDGRSQGLTAPNGPSQQRVIRQALSSCRLTPEDIDAVEAHGTGTSLGDPIEAGALAEVFGPGRAPERPVYLGSAKSNLGHAQAAAGVAGVMKMVLAMQHEELPKTLHAEEPSPHIGWEGSGLSLLQQARPWPRGGRVRRAGVSSFGISGTNAHVILEEAPAVEPQPAPVNAGPLLASSALPLVLSGRDEAALRAQAERWARWLKERPGYRWADVVSAAALHRTHFEARAAVLAGSAEEAAEGLSALAEGRGHASVSVGKARAPGKVVFVFPGQGSQWLGMGRALLEQSPAFAEAVEACDAALKRWTGWSVAAILRGEQGEEVPPFTRVDVVQPALFAMSVGLAAAWRSLGVEPAAVVGHSQGEVAAAVVAGALSLQDGARVVALRSQAVRKCTGKGGMVLVERPVSEVQGYIEPFGEALSIAAVNTASSTVVSGDARAVDELVASLQAREVFCRKVNVDYASHSAHMDELLPELASQLASLEPRPSTIPFYSTVTGALLRDEALDGEYWCRNLRLPVRLDKALVELLADGHGVFVEVSAHPILAMPLTTACAEAQGVVVGSLQRGEGGLSQLSGTLGALHVQGYEVDWKRLFGGQDARHVDLPTYAFQRQRYWLEASKARSDLSSAGLRTAEHPLLGAATRLASNDGYVVTSRLSLRERPWLRDHAVFGKVLFPGTGMLELALSAARAVGGGAVSELILAEPLVLSETEARRVQLSVEAPDAQGRRGFGLYSQPEEAPEDAPWVQHATGTLTDDVAVDTDAPDELRTWPVPGAEAVDLSGFYERLHERGLQYGPAFRGLVELWRRGASSYGRVVLPEAVTDGADEYGVHPALLDAALHTIVGAFGEGAAPDEVSLPFAWSDVELHATGASELRVRFELQEQGAQQLTGGLFVTDAAGEPVVRVGGLQVRRANAEQLRAATRAGGQHLYRVEFQPVSFTEALASGAQVVLRLADGPSPLADALGAEAAVTLEDVLAKQGTSALERVVVDATTATLGDDGVRTSAHEATRQALLLLQAWLSEPRLESVELVWVTRNAIAAGADDRVDDLVHAPLWGLVRAARNEHPDRRLRLLDVGPGPLDGELLARALATTAEPELALRDGAARAARLVRVQPVEEQATARPLDPSGTVLVTGGTGELGQAVAEHLVREHGARHLVLTSRRGLEAPGARELLASLEQLGAETVTIAACDVSDRAEVARVLAGIAPEHPLTAVWHLAGVLDDGMLAAQTPERLSRVLAPKLDGSLHLHELTRELSLASFVLFSSASGTLGTAGQSNYAAANAFLDALAAHRRGQGLPAMSLAWGLWTQAGVGMTAHLGEAEVSRMRRAGFVPISAQEGLALLDAALARPEASLVPVRFDLARLQRSIEADGEPPALLRALVRPALRKASSGSNEASALRERLSALPEPERLDALLELVRTEVALVAGLPRGKAVQPDQVLRELGLDSLMAVQLRNRLSARAQTKLSATLAFDYPTPRAIAELLLKQAFSGQEAAAPRAKSRRKGQEDEPIAIVSMACRLPGGVESPEEYWRLLLEGRDAIEGLPGRWDALSVYDPDPEAAGKSYAREGGFLRDIDLFDAGFFGISPREAQSMDPQQRLVLETAWEALERAGVRPSEVSGSATGVYLGSMGSDYGSLQGGGLESMDGYRGTGSAGSVISGRVAYVLGLQGPAMTVDTACSSSLVALHLACTALRQGECDMALAGGVTVMSTPALFVEFSRLKGMAPDGRCKSFSAQADGAGWAEGCGVLVLKRLSDAQRDGDRVLAVVRGSAVNQDGRSQGFTAPNGPSQQRVIRQALSSCRLTPEDIDAVEAHGTGTGLGDPIEAGALAEVFGPGRAPERPVYLGSSKSNLGHAQAAAGVAGVMKMVLAMQHEVLPRTLHAEEPSPHVAWEGSGLSLLQQAHPWPRGGRVRRAGVSSFGISGTNAHVILEEAPPAKPPRVVIDMVPAQTPPVLPLVLSGRDEAALRGQAERWARWLAAPSEHGWADVVSAAALTRVHFEARAAVAAGSAEEAAEGLSALAEGRAHKAVVQGAAARGGKLAVLFTGQGSQRPGMGKGLYEAYPVFRQALDAVCEALDAHLDQPLRAVMFAEAGSELGALLEQTSWTQPALFALEVALFRQWQAWGVQASVLAGHSIGELSAAHVSGMLSLSDAARLVCARGRLMQACEPGGAMVSIEASEAEVAPALAEFAGRVDIAALNGPRQTVISGDAEAVQALSARFEVLGRRTRRLRVSHAFHSAHMDSMLAAFEEEAERCEFLAPRIPLVSHVDGAAADEAALRTPAYWVRQVRKAVRFADAMRSLQEQGVGSYLECGPDGVLAAMGAACLAEGAEGVFVASLRKDQEEARSLVTALGQLHVHGHALDWKQVLAGYPARRVDLPTYAFQRQRYWLDAPKPPVGAGGASESERALWEAVEEGKGEGVAELLALPDEVRGNVSPLLPYLAAWRHRNEAEAAVGSWLYEEAWRREATAASGGVGLSGRWLLVAGAAGEGLAKQVTEVLGGAGAEVVRLEPSQDRAQLAAALKAQEPVSGVVSLTALDEESAPERPQRERGLHQSLTLAQALGDAGIGAPLWLLTQGAVAVDDADELTHPSQALVWGLGRVVALEHAGRWGGLVDVPAELDVGAAQQLRATLASQDEEDQVAIRRGGRFVRRLVRVRPQARKASWKVRGTVLVTGGVGGLGAHLARWLAERGAEHLVLTSRRGADAPGAAELREELVGRGVRVTLAACDVSEREQVEALLAMVEQDEAPLRAVAHLAGVVRRTPLAELAAEQVADELGAKVGGAWHLHELLEGRELDAFVMYGSIAGLWGSGAQGAYSAANAALDALARHRRQKGLAATVLHWGPWAEGGMVNGEAEEHLRLRGLASMAPDKALACLELVLRAGSTSVGVADVDWSRFVATFCAARRRPLLEGIEQVVQQLESSRRTQVAGDSSLQQQLRSLPEAQRYRHVRDLIAAETAAVLRVNDPGTLDPHRGLLDLGLDSLMAVELTRRLRERSGLAIPSTLVFDHPTLDAAARWLLEQLTPGRPQARESEVGESEVRAGIDASEPMAIVGVGLRMPGGARDLDGLWSLLAEERDTLRLIPPERFDVQALYDADPDAKGKTYVRHASLMEDVASFDASFFGISPREAEPMDPQQRLLLETAWNALEDAGVRADQLRGSDTGVFVGVAPSEYAHYRGASAKEDAYALTGTALSFSAGRVAYHLGLQGPAVSVDTACSSSLVALHLACEALRRGDCAMALAAGVQVIADPSGFVLLSRTRAVSADGRCKTFSEAADGYGRGEGVAVVVLMRLSDAQAQGKRVLGLVRGTAVNQDGASSGITAPNGTAQQKVLRAALRHAGLRPADIDVVECHGTGTSLGDPIEVQALGAVYGQGRDAKRPLLLGAIKSNIGHLESASGLAGLCKVLAAFRHEALPATLHSAPRNTKIPWESLPVQVVDRLTPWPRRQDGQPRRAGVSSFGISGTNAHVILEEAPPAKPPRTVVEVTSWAPVLPLVLSGRDEAALRAQAERWARWLAAPSEHGWADVVSAAALTRVHFEARAAVAAGSAEEAAEGLSALAEGRAHKAVVLAAAARDGKLAVLFTGQGSQRPGMGKGLYEAYPVFRQALDAVCEALDAHLDQPLRTVMFAEADSELGALLEQTSWTQPALFALEVALFRQWQAWGVQASVLAGHSIGELSAAHVSGMLSLSDAARLVCARGRLMQACEPGGVMVSLEASEAEVAPALAEFAGRVDIAAINGPRQTVISGDAEAVQALSARFEVLGRRTRRLRVSHAFHSAHMDSMLAAFEEEAERCEFLAPRIPLVSHVDGAPADEATLRTPAYWVRQVRKAVRFADAMRSLQEHGVGSYLECGPDGVLAAMGAACLAEGTEGVFVASLRKDQEEARSLVTALGQLHVHGHELDWKQVLAGYPARHVDLPTYAFQGQRYWLDAPKVGADVSAAGLRPAEHPLLGAATRLADSDGALFTSRLSLGEQPWLRDHAVYGNVLFPGTGMLELALAAARATGNRAVSELVLAEPLVLSEAEARRVQLSVEAPGAQGRRGFGLYSQPEDAAHEASWVQHATGVLTDEAPVERAALDELRTWPVPGAEAVDLTGFYERLHDRGLQYGPAFQGLVELSRRDGTFYGRVVLPEAVAGDAEAYNIHPALLDAALHTMVAAFDGAGDDVSLPFAWSDVMLHASGASELRVRFELREQGAQQVTGALAITDAAGEPVASVAALQVRRATAEQVRAATRVGARHLYRVDFQPVALAEVSSTGAAQVVLGALQGQAPLAEALGLEAISELDDVLARIERGQTPVRVIVDATSAGPSQQGLAASVHEATARALRLLQAWMSESRFEPIELVWVTRDAIGVDAGDSVQALAHAPLWGLVRSARSEHPERRLRLLDVDGLDAQLVRRALATTTEPELSLRGGAARAARLAQAPPADEASAPARALDPEGTVLVTGGTGELGQALAAHLVREHGVRHLLLTSRRGLAAAGAPELVKALAALGAESVTVAACDTSDRTELANALAAIAPDRPLTAVFHLAGVLDDGVLAAQTPERLSRVLAPKVDGALHLHELTQRLPLAAFVLFSSMAGTLGAAGQSNYAAANTFLDALAAHRRHRGLPAMSLAWGLWAQAGVGMTAHLGGAELSRLRRAGFIPMSEQQGLRLLDAALLRPEPVLVPVHFDLARLQRSADDSAELPALLRALVRPGLRKASSAAHKASALRERLSALHDAKRLDFLLDLVRSEIAAVLGLDRGEAVKPEQVLKELGLDSLLAVELRNRLSARSQTTLPATLAFDYPTPRAIAELLLKQAFSELHDAALRPRSQSGKQDDELIAIVSMACRLPGGIASPEDYWRLLSEGRDAIEVFPSRWDAFSVYDPDPEAVGKSYVREGGFLRDIDLFDAAFFGISPREAESMDPQQRLVLETAWEALERAGVRPASLSESATGVYLGWMGSDYGAMHGGDLESLNGYRGTGSAASVISGRIAYALGLQGPAMTVDTACSSSLVTLHLACAALRQGECDLALTGGVTVMTTPASYVEFSRLKGLPRDGRCKSFSARADGAIWSEGCAMLVLKRLSDAQRDGDRVLAVVRGSAVNQDGRSQGLTAPNGPSQQRVIRQALSSCRLTPEDIDAVEAHGTGTSLGDPIEAGALAEVFGPGRAPERPVYLGSAKSNLGHAQAAAGVAGVMKMVLAMQHEELPKTLHAEEPSPHVAWEGSGLSLLQQAHPWPRGGRVRRAGVSSFGISGTNAHVILEEAPAAEPKPAPAETGPLLASSALPLVLSGRDEAALRAQAERWARWLKERPGYRWADVVSAAALHRTHFEARAAVLAGSAEEAAEGLSALAEGRGHASVSVGKARVPGKVVFVFPGQGSQWLGMGRALLEQSAAFAEAVEACDAALKRWTGWSVAAILRGEQGEELPPFTRVDVVQPALFAMSVGLAAAWRSLGVEPAAVVGHSQGEVAAAVIAGALPLQDGARVVALRSQAVRKCAGKGGMVLVERPVSEVQGYIERFGEALSIAAVNTASSTVVSGDARAVDELVASLQAREVFCRKVNVDYASHSAHMDELLPELASQLASLEPRPSTIPFYSTVTGALLRDDEALDGEYWCRNLRLPVRLDKALVELLADGHGVFVEVSAHPILAMPLTTACAEAQGVVVGSLQRGEGGLSQLSGTLGALHVQGYEVDWKRLFGGQDARHVDLPTYAFQRQRYWLEASKARSDLSSAGLRTAEHPLLGAATRVADTDGYLFTGRLSLRERPWLRDHAVFGKVLFPGTGMLELALTAARAVGGGAVSELILAEPLVLSETEARRVQLSVEAPDAQGRRGFGLYSQPEEAPEDAPWVQHATGTLTDGAFDGASDDDALDELRTWPVPGAEAVDLSGFYERLEARGLQYGPAFRGLIELWRRGAAYYGRVMLPEAATDGAEAFGIHPALLDAVLHTMVAALAGGSGADEVSLPFAWSDVELHATGASELRVRFELQEQGAQQLTGGLFVADAAGEPVVRVGGLQVRRANAEQLRAATRAGGQHLYRVEFQPVSFTEALASGAQVVLRLADGPSPLADALGAEAAVTLEGVLAKLEQGTSALERVVVDATAEGARNDGVISSAREATRQALSLLQAWLSERRLESVELVWVTRNAIAAGADDRVDDLVHAPLWGLVRAARNEHPDRRLRLLDVGPGPLDGELLARALATMAEPELALRDGAARAARLVRVQPVEEQATARPLDPSGTVLVTGGTGELGQAVAEHLVREHGARHLVLTSRRGLEAPGARELLASLEQLGAETVTIAACDVSDRAEVARVLAGIAPEHPLTAVWHLAGVLDDGVLAAQTPERLSRVLAPKLDGSLHLHELTRELSLASFVLFSSASGTLGTAGQSNYAAANAFLDALAAHRRGQGLPAMSLAWGLWTQAGVGMTAHLGEAEVSRMRRAGFVPISAQEGLALLDAALARPEASLVPVRFDLARLQRSIEANGEPPALLRALVRPALRKASSATQKASALLERLSALPEPERLDALLELVRTEIALVVGLPRGEAVQPDQVLKDLGLDSRMAVELRNRLSAQAQTALPATLAFDYPTPQAIAKLLNSRLVPAASAQDASPADPEQMLKWVLKRISATQMHEAGLLQRLFLLAQTKGEPASVVDGNGANGDLVHEEGDSLPQNLTLQEIDSKLDAILEQ
ncbi:SDR family NAD(P)-dependent oxidoreductase [Sorangium sp. So ce1036]|uniref:type I polyketide synthase n=1 Tax=Sorangium sp. So ce1036 TaxID=3133328 RepID=UPI003F097A97